MNFTWYLHETHPSDSTSPKSAASPFLLASAAAAARRATDSRLGNSPLEICRANHEGGTGLLLPSL